MRCNSQLNKPLLPKKHPNQNRDSIPLKQKQHDLENTKYESKKPNFIIKTVQTANSHFLQNQKPINSKLEPFEGNKISASKFKINSQKQKPDNF